MFARSHCRSHPSFCALAMRALASAQPQHMWCAAAPSTPGIADAGHARQGNSAPTAFRALLFYFFSPYFAWTVHVVPSLCTVKAQCIRRSAERTGTSLSEAGRERGRAVKVVGPVGVEHALCRHHITMT